MRGHLDTDTLAAFREQLLGRRRSARVAAHLSGCPRCAATDADLAQVSVLLASAPIPPMPAELTARIEAALAAEAASRATQTVVGAPTAASPGPATPNGNRPSQRLRTPRPGRPWGGLALRAAAAAAAVAALAGGGYGLSQLLSGGAAGTAASGAGHQMKRTQGAFGAVKGHGRVPTPAMSLMGPGYPVLDTHTDYQPGRLAAQVGALLTRHGRALAVPGTARPNAPQAPGYATGLAGCVAKATGGRRPQLVDTARYGGRPATVIVMPTTAAGTQVVVVGAGCSARTADVLTRQSVPAHR